MIIYCNNLLPFFVSSSSSSYLVHTTIGASRAGGEMGNVNGVVCWVCCLLLTYVCLYKKSLRLMIILFLLMFVKVGFTVLCQMVAEPCMW